MLLVYISHQCCDTGPRVLRSHPKDCPHLVASYDSQGCREPSYSYPDPYRTRRKLQAELIITFKIFQRLELCRLQDLNFAVVLFVIVHPYMDVTIAGEGVQHPLFLSKGDFYRATPAMTPEVGYTVSIEGPDWSYIATIKLGVLRTYFTRMLIY